MTECQSRLPEYAPAMSDQMIERLGRFYETHDRLHPIPFVRFCYDPLGWCRWAGVSESPYRWRAIPEPKLPAPTKPRWWHVFRFSLMELVTLAMCAGIFALLVGGYIHGAMAR